MIRVLNFGGGTNSAALAIECIRRGIKIDLMPFADTGSEFPHTYEFCSEFSAWSLANGGPPVSVVRWIRVRGEQRGQFVPLHTWCIQHKTAPSRTFGLSGCTVKWKQQPIDKWVKEHPLVRAEHAAGHPVERLIGYDAGEPGRAERMLAKNPQPDLWTWKAPLVDWDLDRDDCEDVIRQAGLPQPGKSSCWMCPSLKKAEIRELARRYPDLAAEAIRIERNADLRTRKGLGSYFSWEDLLREGACPGPDAPDAACGCYDG
jgi:hypothetical protein